MSPGQRDALLFTTERFLISSNSDSTIVIHPAAAHSPKHHQTLPLHTVCPPDVWQLEVYVFVRAHDLHALKCRIIFFSKFHEAPGHTQPTSLSVTISAEHFQMSADVPLVPLSGPN